MTPSDWVRTGRPTSRSSTWPPCGRCRALILVRPADANETAQAWRLAVDAEKPVGLVLSRQDIPVLAETEALAEAGVAKGGYVLAPASGEPRIVLIGTGSEVHLCLDAARILEDAGVPAQVVSLPCWEWFEEQDDVYRAEVLPAGRAGAQRRGGLDVRLEPLCRRLHRARPFRGVRARGGGHGKVRIHG